MAQKAKFELLNYKMYGDLDYPFTEYLIKLHDADGEEVKYHVTDYYNEDISEITDTKIWELSDRVLDLNGDLIVRDMMSSDYEHAVKVFDSHFGDFVTLLR